MSLKRILGASRPLGGPLAIIVLVVGASAAAFAYTAGWFSPARLTPERIVDALSRRGGAPIGHRRNHSKGICFTGTFVAGGEGAHWSTAPMLAQGSYPVIGRFAIAVGNPLAPDAAGRVRSMAIRIVAGGQEWRSGMNNSPVFVVATPQAFYEQALASDIDPAAGKPDPTALKRFRAAHPETAGFFRWAANAPWTTSYADQRYNSLNAFRFIDASGVAHPARWSMIPQTAAQTITPEQRKALGPNFLAADLKRRLAKGPLRWRMVATLAQPGDPTNDATRAWPADRPVVTLGTLVVKRAEDEASGPCRDYNYDPLILPSGISGSDDPLLAARSATYAVSFDRRMAEARQYPRDGRSQ
ncbi:MAG: hypothetical protein BGN85_13955 [Alphaproteobacteria bacterium 64-11]|nr:catalase family peroxidase [Alphaproteobacteria bacterium]OJU13924.1 MAG: hypothetical protein BGN85_13955 [Alphaproteobacteria bacterium 64-11]